MSDEYVHRALSAEQNLKRVACERDAALRLVAQLQAELARWQTNCTGRHGSQQPCGFTNDRGAAK